MEKQVGERIKQLRIEKDLTLKELGERTNLSLSYISLVERGKASITLTTLSKIAEGLGVTSSYFIDSPTRKTEDVVRSYDQPVYKIGGSFVYFGLSNLSQNANTVMTPVLAMLLPGEERRNVMPYSHEGEEFYYVLEGRMWFIVNGTEYLLYPGDSLHIQSDQPHNWGNFTNNIVRVLVLSTKNWFDTVSV